VKGAQRTAIGGGAFREHQQRVPAPGGESSVCGSTGCRPSRDG
jgi:hypothetical protein